MPLNDFLTENNLKGMRLELSVRRSRHGLTYDGLALLSGVSRRALISIETGSSRGSLETWMKICRALDCDFSEFISMSEEVRDVTAPGPATLQSVTPKDPQPEPLPLSNALRRSDEIAEK